MSLRDLIPFNWGHERDRGTSVPVRRAESPDRWPTSFFGSDFDRLFDTFFGDLPATFAGGAMTPRVNVRETEKEYVVEAEMPGLDEKDLKITVDRRQLVLSGEKKHENREEKDGRVHRLECSYGRFERRLALPDYVKADDARATCKNGVVTVTFAKDAEKTTGRRIPVTTG